MPRIKRLRVPAVPRTVLALGLTSLFTDISSEMVSTILPLYFLVYLALSPMALGVLDGLYQGGSVLARVAGGFAADRLRRSKEIAVIGYGLSAVCKLGLLLASTASLVGIVIVVDRTGKGIRTAPRDAMISRSVPSEHLGTAFGVHRALDTAGAMIGPLVAFAILTVAPGAFDAVFVVSFCVALIGLGILILLVGPQHDEQGPSTAPIAPQVIIQLFGDRSIRGLAVAGTLLSLLTVSDSFVYLVIQQHLSLMMGVFPLLFVVTSLVYFLLALPAGRLADRFGRGWVFLGGYGLLLACMVLLLCWPLGASTALAVLILLGAYYAATDGVLMALGSAILPDDTRGTGLGLLSSATGLARLLSSVIFGAAWTWGGPEVALLVFAIGLTVALTVSIPMVRHAAPAAS
jgi:MFS family permease